MEGIGINFEPERALELESALVLVDDGFMIWDKKNNVFYPFLMDKMTEQLPQLEVDNGAAEHIKLGANVMRPGITKIDSRLKRGWPVLITNNKASLAVAIPVMDYAEAILLKKGVIAKNVHRQGDQIWEAVMQFINKYHRNLSKRD